MRQLLIVMVFGLGLFCSLAFRFSIETPFVMPSDELLLQNPDVWRTTLTERYDELYSAGQLDGCRTLTGEMLYEAAQTRLAVYDQNVLIQPEQSDPAGRDYSLPAEDHLLKGLHLLADAGDVLEASRRMNLPALPRGGSRDMWFGGTYFIHSGVNDWQPSGSWSEQWGVGRSMEFEELMKSYGLDYLVPFAPTYAWKLVESPEGSFDFSADEYYLSEMERLGLYTKVDLYEGGSDGSHLPDWFTSQYAASWRDIYSDGEQMTGSVMALRPVVPEYMGTNTLWLPQLQNFVQSATQSATNYSSVAFYCLSGEQVWWGRSTSYHPDTQAGFPVWLENHYGSLSNLNASYQSAYASWNEISPPPVERATVEETSWGASNGVGRTARIIEDYHTYTEDLLADYEIQKSDWIAAIDPSTPVTGGRGASFYYHKGGFCRSGYNGWKLTQAERGYANCDLYSSLPQDWNLDLDLTISYSGKPGYAVEFNAVESQTGTVTRAMAPGDFRTCMWSAIGHGLKGGSMWGLRRLEPWNYSPNFSVLDEYSLPLETGIELIQLNNQTRLLSQVLSGAMPVQGPIALYFPRDTFDYQRMLLDDDSVWNNPCMGYPWAVELRGMHQLLNSMGFSIRFITEATLSQLAGVEALVMPWTPLISESAMQAISDFTTAGGTVITAGAPGRQNEYFENYPDWPGGAFASLFGVSASGPESVSNRQLTAASGILQMPGEYSLDPDTLGRGLVYSPYFDGKPYPALKPYYVPWRHVLQTNDAAVIAQWDDGAAAITERAAGSGRAVLVSTLPGTLYETSGDSQRVELRELMTDLLGDIRPEACSLNPAVETALLENENGCFLICVNRSDTIQEAEVQVRHVLDPGAQMVDLLEGDVAATSFDASELSVSLSIEPQNARIFRLQPVTGYALQVGFTPEEGYTNNADLTDHPDWAGNYGGFKVGSTSNLVPNADFKKNIFNKAFSLEEGETMEVSAVFRFTEKTTRGSNKYLLGIEVFTNAAQTGSAQFQAYFRRSGTDNYTVGLDTGSQQFITDSNLGLTLPDNSDPVSDTLKLTLRIESGTVEDLLTAVLENLTTGFSATYSSPTVKLDQYYFGLYSATFYSEADSADIESFEMKHN